MITTIRILFVMSLIGGLGCQRSIDLPVSAEPQLGITCFLAPDQDFIEVSVFRSQGVGASGGRNPTDFVLPDASVQVQNLTQGSELTIPFDPDSQRYRLPAPTGFLLAEANYRLTVAHPSYATATATCVIPSAPLSLSLRLDSTFQGGRPLYFAQPSWAANPEGSTYFRLIGQIKGNLGRNFFFGWEGQSDDPDYIVQAGFTSSQIGGPVGNLQAYPDPSFGFPGDRVPGDSVRVELLQVSESYYQFQLSLRKARNQDPLLSEPYTLYSHFEGAQGVLAAYNKTSVTLRVK
jgi:hypothetical protein